MIFKNEEIILTMMRKKLFLLFFFILIFEMTLGRNDNKTKFAKSYHKKRDIYSKEKTNYVRTKRSINENEVKTYLSNVHNEVLTKSEDKKKNMKRFAIEKEPFWGTRGRRDSLEESMFFRDLAHPFLNTDNNNIGNNCKHCSKSVQRFGDINKQYSDEKREEADSPFWGNRGRRNSDETENVDRIPQGPFWGVRGRRQENEPFWGTRGRRQDDVPFWGNRGRREDEPFWGQRGRKAESEPFWGNRGKREDDDPFWGTRGRRQETEPFWGNRGKKKEIDVYSNIDDKEKEDIKSYIRHVISTVEHNIENLVRLKKNDAMPVTSFWKNWGRTSQLKSIFNDARVKTRKPFSKLSKIHLFTDPAESRTVLDNRIYADEPHFILVERSSRSSSEDDPFFISRGKKVVDSKLAQAARNRRGSIEELVKSVRNDPYYIARGKKNSIENEKLSNSTVLHEKLQKAKDLICTTLGFIMTRGEHNNVKREIDDNERDRRTILKKLAAQLQNDPYFASRGKKKEKVYDDDDNLLSFIGDVAEICYD